MNVSKFNAEGYYDPTAYEGIRRAEKKIEILRINYPTGFMEVNVENFFPCTMERARKVFSIIHRYSSEEDKDLLQRYFFDKEDQYYVRTCKYADKASSYPEKSFEHREYLQKFKEARRMLQQMERNRKLFMTGRSSK